VLLDQVRREALTIDKTIAGFNVGMNCGETAGQTIMHCHVHLIPRRKGDVEQPRGGVRGVIPAKQAY
jgi:diadenosine tetraphosphate (Ap4A) HIT family hydrolase